MGKRRKAAGGPVGNRAWGGLPVVLLRRAIRPATRSRVTRSYTYAHPPIPEPHDEGAKQLTSIPDSDELRPQSEAP